LTDRASPSLGTCLSRICGGDEDHGDLLTFGDSSPFLIGEVTATREAERKREKERGRKAERRRKGGRERERERGREKEREREGESRQNQE
jgi:hypothetical protein